MRAGARKQAMVPVGATVLEPVGTAPGLLVGSVAAGGRAARAAARAADDVGRRGHGLAAVPSCWRARGRWSSGSCASSRCPSRRSRRRCARSRERPVRGHDLPAARGARGGDRLRAVGGRRLRGVRGLAARAARGRAVLRRRGDDRRGRSRGCSAGRTIATAESCTGGLMAGRLTDLAGSSAYVLGGLVVYSNEAKTALAGVPAALIEAHGAVSPEVATALSRGRPLAAGGRHRDRHHGHRRARAAATPTKPVGTVCISVSTRGRRRGAHRPRSRAAAPTSATARRRSRCTCSARCSCGHDERPLRLFVALDLPPDVRDALAAVGAAADPEVWRAARARDAARHARVPRRAPARTTSPRSTPIVAA